MTFKTENIIYLPIDKTVTKALGFAVVMSSKYLWDPLKAVIYLVKLSHLVYKILQFLGYMWFFGKLLLWLKI